MNNFLCSWKENQPYFDALQVLASLSKLFADGHIPYLDYRLAENIFCKFYDATNEARACTAYDAKIDGIGIGIKTFILKNGQSAEKIAEFNRLKPQLDPLSGVDLARKLGEFRNARIQVADDMYGTTERVYHIVGRGDGFLRIFNTSYDCIDLDAIQILRDDNRSFSFHDGVNEYFFNRSKTVLIKRFLVPEQDYFDVPVSILADPLPQLLDFFRGLCSPCDRPADNIGVRDDAVCADNLMPQNNYARGIDYVILPLYSTRGENPIVPEKSGLNQWNAGGRPRDPDEIYIPIPRKIHQDFPDFFPPRNEHFTLILPNGQRLSAKVCQDGCKALMSTHNADLGRWLLRQVLHKNIGELVTIDDLYRFGIDSVRVVNKHTNDNEGHKEYCIEFTTSDYEAYSIFAEE